MIPLVWVAMGTGCETACADNNDCAVGAYCTTAGDCETKACEPTEGNPVGPKGHVGFCHCLGDVLHWKTSQDDGACTYGCAELTWTSHTKDCAAEGTACGERIGVSERPVVGCM